MPRFHLISLGCAKNRVDSEIVLADLIARGFEPIDDPEKAEVIIVNTCAFIRPAVDEAVDNLLAAAELKATGRAEYVVGLGCLPQRYGEDLAAEMAEVDLFVSASAIDRAGRLIEELIGGGRKSRLITTAERFLYDAATPRALTTTPGAAYVKIAEGCPNRCAYCTIPDIRGPQQSRPVNDVLAEISALGRSGVVEVTLLAQDLTAYGEDLGRSGRDEAVSLLKLLEGVEALNDGPNWVRLLYLNPGRLDDELVRFIAGAKRVLPYLDLPLQHVRPALISRMGRKPPAEDVLAWLERLRNLLPGVVIRTTLMTGYPGETEADFEAMLEFVQRAEIDHLGAFAFCPEEGVRAAEMADQVPEETAQARLEAVLEAQREVSRRLNRAKVGRRVEVLVEGPHPESDLMLAGRAWFQAPEVDGRMIITAGKGVPGAIQPAVITAAHDYDLVAELEEIELDPPGGDSFPQDR